MNVYESIIHINLINIDECLLSLLIIEETISEMFKKEKIKYHAKESELIFNWEEKSLVRGMKRYQRSRSDPIRSKQTRNTSSIVNVGGSNPADSEMRFHRGHRKSLSRGIQPLLIPVSEIRITKAIEHRETWGYKLALQSFQERRETGHFCA